jgi:hypothetical protein
MCLVPVGIHIDNLPGKLIKVSTDTKIVILSLLEPIPIEHQDVLISMAEFGLFFWSSVIISLLVLLLLNQLCDLSNPFVALKSVLYWKMSVIRTTLNDHRSQFKTHVRQKISQAVVIWSIWLIQRAFSSLLSTELVVRKQPETINTIEQLMHRPDLSAIMLKDHWSIDEFKLARGDSIRHKLWQRVQNSPDNLFTSRRLQYLLYNQDELIKKRSYAFVGVDLTARIIQMHACHQMSIIRMAGHVEIGLPIIRALLGFLVRKDIPRHKELRLLELCVPSSFSAFTSLSIESPSNSTCSFRTAASTS